MLIFFIVTAVILAAALAGLYSAYYKTFYSPHKGISETDSPDLIKRQPYRDISLERTGRLAAMPCETLTVRSYDGLKLSARYYPGQSGKPLFICFHGYRGSALRDHYGIGVYLIDEGYPVILVDERAHWRSGGHTITFGIRERRDVLSWVEEANRRFGSEVPVYLFGISMGGGAVIMASGQKLPGNVRGIIADCPFNAPKDIIRYVCRKINLNPDLCWPVIRLSGLIYGRFNVNQTSAAKEAAKSEKPILIIHGEDDDFVPADMSRQIKDANPDQVEWIGVPEANHGQSYLFAPERYQEAVEEFIQKTL